MMFRTLLLTSATAFLALGSTGAQARVTDADKSYLTQDLQGGRYELALAKLGAVKAMSPSIRRYAEMVARDHVQANGALMRLATMEGVANTDGMTSKDDAMLTKLKSVSGSSFDRVFIDEMNRINAEDKQSADQELRSTHDRAIKSYIGHFASMDAKHKKIAAGLRSTVS